MLRLWNTATRRLEEIHSRQDRTIGMYTCGLTVYGEGHIGNFRAFLVEDILQRVLEVEGFNVTRVMNVTDVGHLVGDGDVGEDKVLTSARKQGMTAWEIAERYTQIFLEDAKALNIRLPEPPYLCKATDHIPKQIELIRVLEEKGMTYKTSDGIYFNTQKFPSYGKLSRQRLDEKQEGARVLANTEKRHPSDFALWKFSYAHGRSFDPGLDDPAQRRAMEWESPWGLGFPGWHIECSAMSRNYLGQPFDIHCGGIDHISVHHENEIAQSEAAFGVPLARHWMHVEFLLIDGQKMSKSLGNTYTLRDLQAHGIEPLAFRFYVLGAHYRQKQNFTFDAAEAAQQTLQKLRQTLRTWDEPSGEGAGVYEQRFLDALSNDLNTPQALAIFWELVQATEIPTSMKATSILRMDRLLGLSLKNDIAKRIDIPAEIALIAQERLQARKRKDWAASDKLRHELETRGWQIEDTPEGYKLSR